MASAKTTKVFEGLRCPHCGEVDTLSLRLDELEIECRECSEDVTRAEVEAMIAQWQGLLAWLDAAAAIATSFVAPK